MVLGGNFNLLRLVEDAVEVLSVQVRSEEGIAVHSDVLPNQGMRCFQGPVSTRTGRRGCTPDL